MWIRIVDDAAVFDVSVTVFIVYMVALVGMRGLDDRHRGRYNVRRVHRGHRFDRSRRLTNSRGSMGRRLIRVGPRGPPGPWGRPKPKTAVQLEPYRPKAAKKRGSKDRRAGRSRNTVRHLLLSRPQRDKTDHECHVAFVPGRDA